MRIRSCYFEQSSLSELRLSDQVEKSIHEIVLLQFTDHDSRRVTRHESRKNRRFYG